VKSKRDVYRENAQETLKKIREQLVYGSNAAIDDDRSDHKRVFAVRAMVTMSALANALLFNKGTDFPVMAKLNSLAIEKYGYGNCGEQSLAAFDDLVQKGIYPIDLCVTSEGIHQLLLLGRNPDSDLGEDAIILDTWTKKIYPLKDLPKMQADRESGKYHSCPETDKLPHYLSGKLEFLQSIQTQKDLIEFKKNMDIDNRIINWFAGKITTNEELKMDFVKIVSHYNELELSINTAPALKFFLQAKNNIETLNILLKKSSQQLQPCFFHKEKNLLNNGSKNHSDNKVHYIITSQPNEPIATKIKINENKQFQDEIEQLNAFLK